MNNAAVIVDTKRDVKRIADAHYQFLDPSWMVYVFDKNIPVKSYHDYNRLLTSAAFWEKIPAENILVFQHDSGLLRKGIEEFMGWSWVGAPWKFQAHGGNGGLSIRKKSAMLEVIKNDPWKPAYGNEDVYFCNRMKNIAPREVCEKFSVESIFRLGTLGFHGIDNHLTAEQCQQIRNQYL